MLEGGFTLVSASIGVSVAVLCLLLALAARPGERDWGGRLVGRLETLVGPPRGLGVGRGGRRRGGRPGWPEGPPEAWSVRGRVAAGAAAAAAGAGAGWMLAGGTVPAVLCGTAAVLAWEARRSAAVRARRRRFRDGLEAMIEVLVASFKAGHGPVQALEEARRRSDGPVRQALDRVLDSFHAGAPLQEALRELARGWPATEAVYLAACLETHLRTGGDVAALLVNLAGVLRDRRQLTGDLAARTGEARSTAVLLGLLAPALLGYILWVEPAQLGPLLTSPVGLAVSVYAAVSWGVGVVVVRRMVEAVAREVEGEG
ncbi:MAG TPA: hypothetical protein DGR79_07190 [Clostridiales bacterium]|nr:hypothetical protein [Clostridiales bacterium]